MQRFIVGEISKNWIQGHDADESALLSEQFENMLEVNRGRGYRLLTFSLHRLLTAPNAMNETIIAVFERGL